MRPLPDWIPVRKSLVEAGLQHTQDRFRLENAEEFSVTYSLSAPKPTMTITATVNLQKIYNPTDGSFTVLADGVPDEPQTDPVDSDASGDV
ncbi:MAG: hypothetical protein AB1589_40085 [Cyanobacteriota bacterium]